MKLLRAKAQIWLIFFLFFLFFAFWSLEKSINIKELCVKEKALSLKKQFEHNNRRLGKGNLPVLCFARSSFNVFSLLISLLFKFHEVQYKLH